MSDAKIIPPDLDKMPGPDSDLTPEQKAQRDAALEELQMRLEAGESEESIASKAPEADPRVVGTGMQPASDPRVTAPGVQPGPDPRLGLTEWERTADEEAEAKRQELRESDDQDSGDTEAPAKLRSADSGPYAQRMARLGDKSKPGSPA